MLRVYGKEGLSFGSEPGCAPSFRWCIRCSLKDRICIGGDLLAAAKQRGSPYGIRGHVERVTAVFPFSGHLCLLFLCRKFRHDRQIFHADAGISPFKIWSGRSGDIGAKFSRKFSGAEKRIRETPCCSRSSMQSCRRGRM